MITMDKKNKIIILISMIGIILILVAASYAYFSANVTGAETASTIVVTGGQLSIVYDNLSNTITINDIYPRSTEWVSKNFTVTGNNTTDLQMEYRVGLEVMGSGFSNGDLTYTLTNTRSDSGSPIANTSTSQPVPSTGTVWFGKGSFNHASNQVHAYTLKIYFKDSGTNQNNLFNASFAAKVVIESINTACKSDITTIISYDINYNNCMTYMQNHEGYTNEESDTLCSGGGINPWGIDVDIQDGWYQDYIDSGAIENVVFDGDDIVSYDINYNNCMDLLINEWEYTNEIADNICTGGTMPLDSIDTFMIYDNKGNDFEAAGVIENVTKEPKSTLASGDSFTLGQYTYTYIMDVYFGDDVPYTGWKVSLTDTESTLPVTSPICNTIDGNKLIDMGYMYNGSKATSIDLSTIDTSQVRTMNGMFYGIEAASLDLSKFNTSNVIDMKDMFHEVKNITVLDISSFNTSRVKYTERMFMNTLYLNTIYVSNTFTVNNVTSYGDEDMFFGMVRIKGGNGTTYSHSNIRKAYARIDAAGTPGYFTDIADKP